MGMTEVTLGFAVYLWCGFMWKYMAHKCNKGGEG